MSTYEDGFNLDPARGVPLPDTEIRTIGGMAVADHQTAETMQTGYLSPEFIAERESFWTEVKGRKVFFGCGDDRPPTVESAQALIEAAPDAAHTLAPAEGYASIYGGKAGMAKNLLVVAAAVHGPAFLDEIGGFDGAMEALDSLEDGDIFTIHTAAGDEEKAWSAAGDSPEKGRQAFCSHCGGNVGCAYCMGVGATSDLLTNENPLIRGTARADQHRVFGSDAYFDDIIRGHRDVLNHATSGKGAAFAVDRTAYAKYAKAGTPVMVLDGSHVDPDESGVISNFKLDEVGDPTGAHNAGKDFYRLDIGPAVKAVLPLCRRWGLPVEAVVRALQIDSTPVRAVLKAHAPHPEGVEPQLDPRGLAMGYRGGARTAIAELQALLEQAA